jgi:hypothetical protein
MFLTEIKTWLDEKIKVSTGWSIAVACCLKVSLSKGLIVD